MTKLKVGLIGAGVFGGHHAGKIAQSKRTEFVGIYDPDPARCTTLAEQYQVASFHDQTQLLQACDAVIIACPALYHEAVVRAALVTGAHVMVEKPLALTGYAADNLAALAAEQRLILQVGHQERFVLEAMGLFDINEAPMQIEAVRAGPPAPDGRAGDVSVIWDLMIHDLDMVARLMGSANGHMPQVETAARSVHTDHVDEATANVTYACGRAEIHASRCANERDRRMSLQYSSGTIAINFLTREIENTTPFAVKVDVSDILPDPLAAADEAFFAACLGERACAIPGAEAAYAVHLAEQAELSALHTLGA